MPQLFTSHTRPPEIEAEFAEIWRILDSLGLTVQWILRRLEPIEMVLGITPEPPPGGLDPGGHDWPT